MRMHQIIAVCKNGMNLLYCKQMHIRCTLSVRRVASADLNSAAANSNMVEYGALILTCTEKLKRRVRFVCVTNAAPGSFIMCVLSFLQRSTPLILSANVFCFCVTAARPSIITRPSPTRPSHTRPIACERDDCRTQRPCERDDCRGTQPPCQHRECLRFSTQPPCSRDNCSTRKPCEREECRGTVPPCEARECLRFTSHRSCTREDCRGTEAPCQTRECMRFNTHAPCKYRNCPTQAPCEREGCRTEPPCEREACRTEPPCHSRECMRSTTHPPCTRGICANQVQCQRQECPPSLPCHGLNCQHWTPGDVIADMRLFCCLPSRYCTHGRNFF